MWHKDGMRVTRRAEFILTALPSQGEYNSLNDMNRIEEIYDCLLKIHGPQGWWPLRSLAGTKSFDHRGYSKGRYEHPKTENQQVEVCVGALLTQNTAWTNVEKAMDVLMQNNVLDVSTIAHMNVTELANMIRPAGYFNQKAKKLQLFARHVLDRGLRSMYHQSIPELRTELLSLWGIGPETADSIILYSAHKPIFVIDAYTRRIFSRLGVCGAECEYDELQQLFMNNLPAKSALFKEYHALIVEHAKVCCTKKNNHCIIHPLFQSEPANSGTAQI